MPVWQQLFDELKDLNFMIVAVAEESRGADQARPWIEKVNPTYWSLIDTDHRVASLYGMVNVPNAVWIDEAGKIVRPAEAAGATDHFRHLDFKTLTLAPEHMEARVKAREAYIAAIRDWAKTGKHALPRGEARTRLPRFTPEIAEAHARFRLGTWLRRTGRDGEATTEMAKAAALHPDSWNMWREQADLNPMGLAAGPAFWQRVKSLGDRPYYPPPRLDGFPSGD